MRLTMVIILFVLFFLTACAAVPVSRDFCAVDADCVCGGIDKASGNCFVGNKDYYASPNVDKSQVCPDFCTGIGGNFVTKCVDNNCRNVNKNTFPECAVDVDCVQSACFHASSCVPIASAPKCEGVFGTQECRQGTLDCGGSCACEGKRCVAKNLYVQADEIPII